MRELWAVFNGDLYDRIVWRKWWFERQECYLHEGRACWRKVPFFRPKKEPYRG